MGYLKSLSGIFLLMVFPLIHVGAATFTVSNLGNSGAGSLREMIGFANGTIGTDIIAFSVSGTINLSSPLPALTERVTMDGTSAPGYIACGAPVISLNGGGLSGNGIQILGGASGSRILALNVRNFAFNGIQLIGASNCQVLSCYIGTNLAGTAANGNGQNGIQMEGSADNNRIGGATACDRNVISGNNGVGININACGSDTVSGNYIGLNAAGNGAIGNGAAGINTFGNGAATVIGGSNAGEGNVISGNGTGLTGNGIDVSSKSNCIIRGNYIGLNAAGTSPIGNSENGISLNGAPGTLIGGTGANEGNVIAAHNFHAIVLNGSSNNSVIQGNKCGTNAAGTAAFGNDDSGVIVINTTGVTIGGSTPAARNLLSASLSEYGIFLINADNTIVQGNYIGSNINGTSGLPNLGGGIRVDNGSANCSIGGNGAGEGNLIAFNTGFGVGLFQAGDRQVLISRNSMFCNTGKGIDLNGVGNGNHPAPIITSASPAGCAGTATANNIIEIFYDSLCTPPCQGKDYIATVTANGAGNWSYTGALTPGATLVVTARDVAPPPGNVNNTSEFSCFVILPVEGLTFKAKKIKSGAVKLHWSTDSETNTLSFHIERRVNGGEFEGIDEIPAQGFSSHKTDYEAVDHSPGTGSLEYRLKQLDLDGEFTYSRVEFVQVGEMEGGLEVYPQPADEEINIRLAGEFGKEIQCDISDLMGRILVSGKHRVESGKEFRISTSELASGVYILRIRSGGLSRSSRILVDRTF